MTPISGSSHAEQVKVPGGEHLLPHHQDCSEERILVQGKLKYNVD